MPTHDPMLKTDYQNLITRWESAGYRSHGKLMYSYRCSGCGCYTVEARLYLHVDEPHVERTVLICQVCGAVEVRGDD